MLGINDSYVAHCLNETGAYIISRLKNGDKIKERKMQVSNHYSRPSDLYKELRKQGVN